MIFADVWLAHNKWEFWSLVVMLSFQAAMQGFQIIRQWMTSEQIKFHAVAAATAAVNAESAAMEAARKASVVDARQKVQGAAIEAKVSQDLNATKQVLETVKQIVSGSKNGEGLS